MRVLGQAWSVANAKTLPAGVLPITRRTVTRMAQGLAEAGLRVTLGEPLDSATRDLGLDFFGGRGVDDGFDQLMRTTDAGQAFAAAFGDELVAPVASAGGALAYQQSLASLAASGSDQISFALNTSAPTLVSIADA